MATFLKRYQSGEYEQVWAELLARGSSIRNESLLEDALAVAQETMAKARTNIDWLIERLQAIGYEFKDAIPNKKSLERNILETESRIQKIDSLITYLTEDLLPL